jgi:hypothetical protein
MRVFALAGFPGVASAADPQELSDHFAQAAAMSAMQGRPPPLYQEPKKWFP